MKRYVHEVFRYAMRTHGSSTGVPPVRYLGKTPKPHSSTGVPPVYCRQRRTRGEQGSVYLIALLTLSVLGILATVLGWSATVQARQAQRKEAQLRLESLAKSGVSYATWERRHRNRSLPFTETLNLNEGRVVVRAEPAPQYGNRAIRVTAQAFYKDESLTRIRIVDGNRPYRQPTEFALYLRRALILPIGKRLTVEGDVYIGNNLSVAGIGGMTVDGSLTLARNLTGSVTSTVYTETNSNIEVLRFADMNHLRMSADQLVIGPAYRPFGLSLPNGTLYFVQGDLHIAGTLRGRALVAVQGNLYIDEDLTYGDSDSLYIFIVSGNIIMDDDAETLHGAFVSQGGNIVFDDEAQVYGAVMVGEGTLLFDDSLTIEHDLRLNLDWFKEGTKGDEAVEDVPASPTPLVFPSPIP